MRVSVGENRDAKRESRKHGNGVEDKSRGMKGSEEKEGMVAS